MHDDELRQLVRDAVARHLGMAAAHDARADCLGASWKTHMSHGRFVYLAPTEPDAPCVVEPQVRCHHCGFCQSYGH